MKTQKARLFTLLLSGLILFGCSRYGSELQYVEYGNVHVQITDAPFPAHLVDAAYMTVTKIEARGDHLEEDPDSGGFVTLFEGEQTIDITKLTNGMTQSMGIAEVPVGTYDQVRLYVTDASVELTDGSTHEVKVPSGSQSGIKIKIRPGLTVTGELTSELLLDVDLSRSFVLRGNPNNPNSVNGLIFKPVVRATNMSTTGSLAGYVTCESPEPGEPVEGAQISLYSADTLYTSAMTDASGGYKIMGIEAGTFRVVAEKDGYEPEEAEAVAITAANLQTQDFALQPEP